MRGGAVVTGEGVFVFEATDVGDFGDDLGGNEGPDADEGEQARTQRDDPLGDLALEGSFGDGERPDPLDEVRATSIDLVAAAAAADPPDFAVLPADAGTLTIVFSDIENSTLRAVELRDERWVALLDVHNAIVRRQVARHRGTEIKSQGDGFMLSFPSVRSASSCMIDMQRSLAAVARVVSGGQLARSGGRAHGRSHQS